MRRISKIALLVLAGVTALGGWRAGACAWANMELQSDMHDLALVPRANWGYANLKYHTDDDFRDAVIQKARDYGIELAPDQVSVQRTQDPVTPLKISAEYSVPVQVATWSLTLHFAPSSTKNYF